MMPIVNDATARTPLMVRIKHARALLGGISNTTIWKWIGQGRLEVVYVNRMPFITARSINALVTNTHCHHKQPPATDTSRNPTS